MSWHLGQHGPPRRTSLPGASTRYSRPGVRICPPSLTSTTSYTGPGRSSSQSSPQEHDDLQPQRLAFLHTPSTPMYGTHGPAPTPAWKDTGDDSAHARRHGRTVTGHGPHRIPESRQRVCDATRAHLSMTSWSRSSGS